jgi:hypothetical protein
MLRVLVAFVAVVVQAVSPVSPWSADDEAVYSAIMTTSDLRREVDRFAAAAGLPIPAPMVWFDRSLKLCEPTVPPTHGCLMEETLGAFISGKTWNGREFFGGQVSAEERRALAAALRERNREAVRVQGLTLRNVIWTAPDSLATTLKEASARTRGYVTFSRPAYSAGWAVVEMRYACGGLCGYSWYYLLAKRAASWSVVATELLSIS